METKKWYFSKTIWFNIISGAVAIFALPEFISVLPAVVLPYVALLNAIGNTVLRFITDKGISK